VLGSLILAAVVGLIMQNREQSFLDPIIAGANEQKTQVLLATTIEDIISEDLPRLETTIEQAVEHDPDIHSIKIADAKGKELVSWARSDLPQAVSYWFLFESRQPLQRLGKKVSFEGDIYGTMTIEWNRTRAAVAAEKHAYLVAFAVAFIIWLTSVIGFKLGRSRG
jgi:hypothetical protein